MVLWPKISQRGRLQNQSPNMLHTATRAIQYQPSVSVYNAPFQCQCYTTDKGIKHVKITLSLSLPTNIQYLKIHIPKCQRSTPVIVGWFAGFMWKNTRGVCHQLNYCGLWLQVGHPCRKQNCLLNRSLGTLQLLRATLIVNAVSVAVL
jgi:hypothetical protein